MRRFVCLLCICMLAMASLAMAEEPNPMMAATDALFEALQTRTDGLETLGTDIRQEGDWMSIIAETSDGIFTGWQGVVYNMEAGALVTWADLFADEAAAAQRIEAIAQTSQEGNAYSEHDQVSPVPQDNFAIRRGLLALFYPPEQLSHFSGQAGAFTFYAFELDGLWQAGVPLMRGDVAEAKQVLEETLAGGTLPGELSAWMVGALIDDAEEALTSIDTPDIKHDAAVWRYEEPEMRGAALLSRLDMDNIPTRTIHGVYTERIDFSGLCTGIATREEAVAALGEPTREETVAEADAYSRLPVGETLVWAGHERALEMHFVDNVLHSVTLWAN